MWIVSSPEPPLTVTFRSAFVLRTQIVSLPPPAWISIDSIPVKLTSRPAPRMNVFVTTNVSSIGVPTTMIVSKPEPPLIETGAFWRYWYRFEPEPPKSVVRFVISSGLSGFCFRTRNVLMRNVSSPAPPAR